MILCVFGGGECTCMSQCWPLCEHLFLYVLQCSCLRWLRPRRLYTWLWSMPVEVSDIPSILIIIFIDCFQLYWLLRLNCPCQIIYWGYKLSSIHLSPLSFVRSYVCLYEKGQITLLYWSAVLFPVFLYAMYSNVSHNLFNISIFSPATPSLYCVLPYYQDLIRRQQLSRSHATLFHLACSTV